MRMIIGGSGRGGGAAGNIRAGIKLFKFSKRFHATGRGEAGLSRFAAFRGLGGPLPSLGSTRPGTSSAPLPSSGTPRFARIAEGPAGMRYPVSGRPGSRGRYPRRALRAGRSVHFPNAVLFLDHIRQGDLEQVGRFIRARKVTLETIYPSGLAALHEAVLSGNLECVKLLVKYGADIHQRDETGWTALHMACSDGYPDIARYLISLGADTDAVNDDGDSPSALVDPENQELVDLFKGAAVV
ncbi:protein phosphatase 1 regulatory subunit 27 [Tachyglossus aculeatus]|uniref:protein phosphatase 1 regulatory subunit 27 n=1 Tax=Tachyglossus aculeatus TaxID=9261 RepID=UPI0018F56662|nr:protein phosphatase 1 regulatory subunit 27 [Tachyglossus aculeatus]